MPIKVGSVVRLKTKDGKYVLMTVNANRDSNNSGVRGDFVETIWFDRRDVLHTAEFVEALLEIVPDQD